MKLYSLLFKDEEHRTKRIIVNAETPEVARNFANTMLEERGYGDWKYQNHTEPIRGVITDDNCIAIGLNAEAAA